MRLAFTPYGGADYTYRLTADRTWSRRITEEHRLVYLVDGEDLVILQARFHYE